MKSGIPKNQTYTYNLQPFKLSQVFNFWSQVAWASRQVTISEPLQFDHYGGLEYAAEVALLSRTIRFQGFPKKGGSLVRLRKETLQFPGETPYAWTSHP